MSRTGPVRVLVSGFEPFAGEAVNPSRECVRGIGATHIPGVALSVVELPVSRVEAAPRLLEAMRRLSPHVLIMLGEAGGRDRITPERVAINVDDYHIPDNRGLHPRDEPVVANAPAAYFSSLPLRAMVDALESAGIPAAISNSAGTYLCNHVFYRVMHALAVERDPMRAGFVHLPCLPEQVAVRERACPALALEVQLRAVATCVRSAADSARGAPR